MINLNATHDTLVFSKNDNESITVKMEMDNSLKYKADIDTEDFKAIKYIDRLSDLHKLLWIL